MNQEEKELIDAYFKDPWVREKLNTTLGPGGKIKVDWGRRVVTATGAMGKMIWKIDEIIPNLREGRSQ